MFPVAPRREPFRPLGFEESPGGGPALRPTRLGLGGFRESNSFVLAMLSGTLGAIRATGALALHALARSGSPGLGWAALVGQYRKPVVLQNLV